MQYVRFVGYNKNSKIPTMSLNAQTNKYHCSRCNASGFSIGLYSKIKGIDTKKAYRELLERECFSQDKSNIEISPINLLANIETRDKIYREFLGMLKLEKQHKQYLSSIGLLESTMEDNLYRTIPSNYMKRRLICHSLAKKYNLCGIPGFYQEEDFKWCFNGCKGFFVPVFDNNGYIQGLSIHLDKAFNSTTDFWFSSNGKINGTEVKSWTSKYKLSEDTETVIITDNFIFGTLIKDILDTPVIAFQKISNSYMILKEIENTNIKNIVFAIQKEHSENLDYIIRRICRNLIPLDYTFDIKYISNYKDFFDDNFNVTYTLNKIA